MLTTVLTSLQNLLPTRFVVSSFFPALAFWFAHGLMLFALNAPFRTLASETLTKNAGMSAFLLASVLIGVAMSAYALSALLPSIQSQLEGSWPPWLASFFAPAQVRAFEELDQRISDNKDLRAGFALPDGSKTQVELWQESLSGASMAQTQKLPDQYTHSSYSAKQVAQLAALRRRSRAIPADRISAAVAGLVIDLRSYNANKALTDTRDLLAKLIRYADEFGAAEYRQLLNQRRFTFGTLPLPPTRMGNVAKTVQSYAVDRYDFNFVLFWSRMQRSLQKDKDFGPLLQSAKEQLDFLIACAFLTFLWSAVWGCWLFFNPWRMWLFLLVALAGPALAWIWYRTAVAHYRAFADILRTSIDLFRFDLLQELHLPVPAGVLEERKLWNTLDALETLHDLRDLRYLHPKSL